MKLDYLIIVSMIILGIVMSMVMVQAQTETYQVGRETNLILTCTINNAIPSNSATMNITIAYPNGTIFINNKNATPLGNGVFNYTTTFPIIGTYHPTIICIDGTNSYSASDFYNITGNGKENAEGSR
jgi:hypothetical protein